MTYTELRKVMDKDVRASFQNKAEFIFFITDPWVDGRIRVGGPKGKGRITVKRARALLGV
jgi:hypothetical protein